MKTPSSEQLPFVTGIAKNDTKYGFRWTKNLVKNLEKTIIENLEIGLAMTAHNTHGFAITPNTPPKVYTVQNFADTFTQLF